MANRHGFNATAINTGAASLVFVSAAAAFSGGVATTDFSGGGYVRGAQSNLVVSAQTTFESGSKNAAIQSNLVSTSDNYFEPSVDRYGLVNWNSSATANFNAKGLFLAGADWTKSIQFYITAEFVLADASWIISSDLESDPNRVDFISSAFPIEISLVNDIEPQINGLMTGNWESTNSIWIEPTVDEGLGYINHEAYGFIESSSSWENTSFLTAIFTTGGFLSPQVIFEIIGNRTIYVGDVPLTNESNLESNAVSEQLAVVTMSNGASFGIEPTRTTFTSSDDWANISSSDWRRPHVSHNVRVEFVGSTGIEMLPQAFFIGRAGLTNIGEFEIQEPIIWHRGLIELNVNVQSSAKALRTCFGTLGLIPSISISYVGERKTFASMSMTGFGATMTSSAVLRLIDAPSFRQFIVPKQNRNFSVSNNNKKFEVAS